VTKTLAKKHDQRHTKTSTKEYDQEIQTPLEKHNQNNKQHE
jgi:hypothetical protein